MWNWLIDNSFLLNLSASITILLVGIAIYFVAKPAVLSLKFGEWAFYIWTAQWAVLAVIYTILIRFQDSLLPLSALADLQSILVLATGWIWIRGEAFRPSGIIGFSATLYLFLLLWNLGLIPHVGDNPEAGQAILWITPSSILSSLCFPLLGLAIFMRFKTYGFPFLLVALIYTALDQAFHIGKLVYVLGISQAPLDVGSLYLALAAAKIVMAGLFYGILFIELPSYPSTIPELTPEADRHVRRRLARAIKWLVSAILIPTTAAVIVSCINELLSKK